MNTHMEITIEPSTNENSDELTKLMLGYFSFYNREADKTKIIGLIKQLQEEENTYNKQFIAKYGEEYVGFITLYEIYSTLTGSKILLMNDLFVEKKWRGKGIGKALFRYGVELTKELGYPKMEWVTEPDNEKAIRFYDSLGGKSSLWMYYVINTQYG